MANIPLMLRLIDRMMDKGARCPRPVTDPVTSLQELHIELTYDCNCKCIMCDLWSRNIKDPSLRERELTLEQIQNFIDRSKCLENINYVVLSGGEPFIWPSIVELCDFLTDKFPSARINFLTNGISSQLVFNKLEKILQKRSPETIQLGSSLDGIAETHDHIRGVPGAFDKLVNTVKEVKKRYPEIRYGFNFTITPHNYHDLVKCYDFAETIGCEFCAQFVVQWDVEEEFEWKKTQLDEIRGMANAIAQRIIDKYKKRAEWYILPHNLEPGLLAQIYYWGHLTDYAENPKRLFDRCTAGYRMIQINPYGDVSFCPILKKRVIGNMKEKSLDDIWMSPEAERLRGFTNSKACHCWLVCTVFPMAGENLALGRNMSSQRLAGFEKRVRGKLKRGKAFFSR